MTNVLDRMQALLPKLQEANTVGDGVSTLISGLADQIRQLKEAAQNSTPPGNPDVPTGYVLVKESDLTELLDTAEGMSGDITAAITAGTAAEGEEPADDGEEEPA